MSDGRAFQVAIVAIDNAGAGAVELAVAGRLGNTIANGANSFNAIYLNDGILYSTASEGGGGAADSLGVLYSEVARSSKVIAVLARADYDNGLGAAGAWNVPPSRILLQRRALEAGVPASFFAHRNNVQQTGALHLVYTKVLFTSLRFSSGNFFDTANSRWVPPAGLVQLSVGLWWEANFAETNFQSLPNASADAVAKIIKNGVVDIAAGEGHAPAGFPATAGATVPACLGSGKRDGLLRALGLFHEQERRERRCDRWQPGAYLVLRNGRRRRMRDMRLRNLSAAQQKLRPLS